MRASYYTRNKEVTPFPHEKGSKNISPSIKSWKGMVEIIQETSSAKQSKLTEEKQKVTSEN
jgi:hypothetical protein